MATDEIRGAHAPRPMARRRGDATTAIAAFCNIVLTLALCMAAPAAAAPFTRVLDLPPAAVFRVWCNGDTLAAGMGNSVFVSTDAGSTWRQSSTPAPHVVAIDALWIRNGRLYAGTFGQGVFTSDDLGASWRAFNDGLVGGVEDSQLDVGEFQVRGDSLYAATLGAGVYVRNLAGAGTWSHFGDEFEANQGSNVNGLALGGTRLLAAAGSNGQVFFREPGAGEWTVSDLSNTGLLPGAQSQYAAWNGHGWVVSTTAGVFRSSRGETPWFFSSLNLGALSASTLATQGRRVFGAFGRPTETVIEKSEDDGATWQELERFPGTVVFSLAVHGGYLYAGRPDGLWRMPAATVSASGDGESRGLRFALAGRQPAGDDVRFRFELPAPNRAVIEIFDVSGRRVGGSDLRSWSAGLHEVTWSARDLSAGVYEARLTADGRHQVVRLVHVR